MAIVLDAFASYVQNRLTEIIRDDVPMQLGLSGEINHMANHLRDLNDFLADAERTRINEIAVQEWVGELKRAMYEATDILDLCQIKAMERGSSESNKGCFNPLIFCLRNPFHAHDIGSRIKALNQRLCDIRKLGAAFLNLGGSQDNINNTLFDQSRKTTWGLDLSEIVGGNIREDSEKLVKMLIEKEIDIMVVAIVGVGGIGKSILAKMIYGAKALHEEFHLKIWLSVGQHYDDVQLLRTVMIYCTGHYAGEITKVELERALYDALRGKKLFLVMDDVWSDRAWTEVLKTPIVEAAAPGSRVLVTTRNGRVAELMNAIIPYHHVEKLGPEDAWSLLKKQLPSFRARADESDIDGFRNRFRAQANESDIDRLKDVGMKMIAQCGGLPLAIKVLGAYLCTRKNTRHDWEMLLKNFHKIHEDEKIQVSMYFSYEDMTPCLKQCFLHYSLLPKDIKFYENDIVGMWIGEGFVQGESGELEEIGKACYSELISRSLIDTDSGYTGQRVCNMNDIVRSFAQSLCKDEALVAQIDETGITNKPGSQKVFRLSLESKGLEPNMLVLDLLQAQKSLRSLISVGLTKIKPGEFFIGSETLRILHMESGNAAVFQSLPELKHLRYLSMAHTDVSKLPENICKMILLQYVSLHGCESLQALPESIVKLAHLRYLNLSGTSIISIPQGFHALANLRKLYGFPAHMDEYWCSLQELGPLSHLRDIGLKGLENISSDTFAARAGLGEKRHLTYLKLECTTRLGGDGLAKEGDGIFEDDENQRINTVFDELCPPNCLCILDIQGYFGRQLPVWLTAAAVNPLQNLMILTIEDLPSCIQLPDGLCQLPSLKVLKIRRAPAIRRVGPEFLGLHDHHHRFPNHRAIGFPRLNELLFFGMVEWVEWVWEMQENAQVMPVLEEVLLNSCKLRCIPTGLALHARALRRLVITAAPNLISLDSFPSVVELDLFFSPKLRSISGIPRLQKLTIVICPKLKVLNGVPALQRIVLEDYDMVTLPEYMRNVHPRYLQLDCSLQLLSSMALGKSGLEWHKFRHVEQVKAYAHDGDNRRNWYMMYTRDRFHLDTNIRTNWYMMHTPSMLPDELVGKGEHDIVGTSDTARIRLSPDPLLSKGLEREMSRKKKPSPNIEITKEKISSPKAAPAALGLSPPLVDTLDTISSIELEVVLCKDEEDFVAKGSPSGSAVALFGDDKETAGSGSSDDSAVVFGKDDCELFGIDSPRKYLLKVLSSCDHKPLKVISICGMGGSGKTTVAKAVCRKIANEFDARAFLSVSRKPDIQKIIRSIFDQVNYPCPDFEQCDADKLIEELKICLEDKRYLIVFDDIWDVSIWDLIKPALLDTKNGSRIITTTRNVIVGEHVGCVYGLPFLSYNDAKKLFYRRTLFGSEEHCPSEYRELSNRMLNKCDQLPLAIIAVTGLLTAQVMDLEEWKKVCNSVAPGLTVGESVEDMRRILKQSYDDLPRQLQSCLLYLSIFQEGHGIKKYHLVQRWICEDLIPVEQGQNLQELGENYFHKLVNMSILQPIEFDSFGKAQACRVPMAIHDLIVSLSIKQKLVAIVGGEQQSGLPQNARLLSLQGSNEQKDLAIATKTLRLVSSLSVFCGAHLMLPLSRFQGLQVLDLEKCESLKNNHLNGIGSLAKLRCLILGGTHVNLLPRKIGNLQLLRTLDLTSTGVEELPSNIVKLTQLRHLRINRFTKVPSGIGKLKVLEELVDIDISKSPCILEDISSLPELKVVSIALWSWDERHSRLLSESLCKLSTKKLKHLSIFTCCLIDFESNSEPILQELEMLQITGSTFEKLPNWIGKLTKLQSLSIEVYSLEKEALRILGDLPHLIFLSLVAKRIPGEKLVLVSDEFRCLKTFLLFNSAMAITFEKEAMKSLQRLHLTLQASLTKDFYFGLENLSSLKQAQVQIICFSATDGVVKEAEVAIGSMIAKNPNYPMLEIKKTEEDYMIEDKRREKDSEVQVEDEKQTDFEVNAKEQSTEAKKKSRRARKKNKRKH